MAQQIIDSRVVIEPRAAHFSAIEQIPDVLAWVVANASPAPVSKMDYQAF
jgi:hypothetical protein